MMADDFESYVRENAQPATISAAPAPAAAFTPAAAADGPPAADSFEAFLRQAKGQQDAQTLQQAQGVAVANSDASPDAAGKAAQIARQIGAPQAAVETDLPRYEAQAKAQQNAQILAGSPKLASWVANNPDSARVANDDMDGLSQIEPLFSDRAKTDVEPVLMGLAKGGAGGFNAASLALNRVIGYGAAGVDAVTNGISAGNGTTLSDWWYQHMIQPGLQNKAATDIPQNAPFGVKTAAMVGNLLSVVAQVGLTGGAGAAGETLGAARSASQAIGQAVAHGSRAMAFPALTAAVNTGQDVYDATGDFKSAIRASQMQYVTSTLGGVVPLGVPGGLAKRLVTGALSGIATGEVSRQAMNLVNPQRQDFDPEQTILSGLGGAMLGGVMGPRAPAALHDGVQRAFNDGISAETAEQGGQAIEQLSQIASASKLRAHDPEAFKAFVRSATEDGQMPNVYVDGKTFQDALHQFSVDPSEIPGMQQRIDEAVNTGGDVQIPIEDYATHIAGTDLDKAILPHLKAEEGGMTYSEGQQFYQSAADDMQARARDIVAQQGDTLGQDADIKQIGDVLFQQMKGTGRFPDDVSRASITPVTEFYRTMADRTGMSPVELFRQYPLRIAGENLGADTLGQDEAPSAADSAIKQGPFGPIFDQFKGDAAGAVEHLKQHQTGEAVGALTHPELGDIDLVWGKEGVGKSDGYGLAKLIKHHPEVVGDLQNIIGSMDVVSKSENRAQLESADHKAAIRLKWDDRAKNWLLTAFEKKGGGARTTSDTDGLPDQGSAGRPVAGGDDTARPMTADRSIDDDLQKFYQGNRGAFDPKTNTIALLQGADLSTFLHESGHFFLHTLGDLAARDGAPQQIRDDMDTAIKWMGGKDLADWQSRTLSEQRDMHEQFARGFESYLMEGKAPTQELQSLFSRFRSWLLNVYRNLTSLGVTLSPEVRGVLDRMLASDDAIRQAEQMRGYFPLDLSKAGATGKQQADYAALGQQATEAAISDMQARSLRDMQWASNAKSKALKALQREAVGARRAVREQVEKDVANQPSERARTFLKTGKILDFEGREALDTRPLGAPDAKLNLADIKSMYPESMLDRPNLDALRGLTGKDGMHPDEVAEMFGIGSGDELIRTLTDGETPKDQIARLTDDRMLQQHGELADPGAIDAAANLAVHNEARARFMATGLKLLVKSPISARDLAKAATEAAETAISTKRVRDLNPRQYEVAEAKANKEAIERAPKDPASAVEAQRRALLSNRLAKAAQDAVAQVKKIVADQAKYDKATIRAKMDPDILDQIDALRERFDFRQAPSAGPTKQEVQLQTWIDSQKALGYAPMQHPDMTNPAVRMHYKDMTVEQLRGFNDTIRSMEQIARERKSITIDGKKVDLASVVDELVAKMVARGEKFTAADLVDRPRLGVDPLIKVGLDRAASFLRTTEAEFKPQQFKANQFDMHEVLGPFSKTIFDRVFGANYRKIDMLKGLSTDFRAGADKLGVEWQKSLTELVRNDLLIDVDQTKEMGTTVYRRLTRGDMLGIARHVGNESNFDKLVKGMEWEPRDVWAFLHANMTAKDWDATQLVWDSFEKHWPAMLEMNRRLGNTAPDRIEPRAFKTQFREMAGGYAPVDYDPIRSRLAVRKSDSAAIDPSEGLFGKGYFRADTTTNGSLNARVANYYDRLNLDYHSVERRLHDTVHDLAYREALLDVHKILSNKDFRRQFNLSFGPEQYKALQNWVGDIANGQNRDAQMSRLGSIMQASRRMIVANGIALRVSTVLKHGGSAALKSSGYFSGGGEKYFAARMMAIGTHHATEISGAMQKFSEIRARLMQQDRDYRQTSASLFQPEGLHAKAERFGHSMVAWSDMMTAVPTAWAAYDRAITEGIPKNRGGTGAPMSEGDAVAYANRIVREAHGSNIESSRSLVMQDSNEAVKMFTTLYGFMNNTLGQNMDMADKFRTAGFSKPEVLSRYLMAMIVPALWAGALANHKKEEGWAKWAAGAIAGEYAGMVPMLRDAWSAVEGYHSAGMPSYMSALGAIAKPAQDVAKLARGEPVKSPIKDVGNAIGLAIPGAGQVGTSLQYVADVHGGKERPHNVLDVARGVALGQSNK
jgi:hypothetical protein